MSAPDIRFLFREAARRFSDSVAIEYEDRGISYAALERQSNRLGRHLAARGAGPGVPVAILADNTIAVVTAILGVLKAGAAFMPLDPRLPSARLVAMLDLAQPPLLLADDGMARVLAQLDLPQSMRPVVTPLGTVDGFAALAAAWQVCADPWLAESDDDFAVALPPEAFCYIYFTSGSTGQPKGIAGQLKGIDHFIRWEIDEFGVSPGTRVSQLTTPSFDAYLRDVFTPLCAGGTVCVPDDRTRVLAPGGLAHWLEARRINLLHCVPTVFRLLLNELRDTAALPDLRWVLLSGEPVMPSDVARWFQLFGDRIRLANLYGPSETTMTKFCHLVTADDAKRRTVPIGRPMPGTRVLIVDARNRPCPNGTIGEILIRSPYRALGYYRRPDLTAEVFVPNPVSRNDQADIVYRTGDLGRVLEDGNFELIGRRDQQTKIRGVRVELSEIEGRLREMPDVADAAVVAHDDASGAKTLYAYVVLRADLSAAALRAWLALTLPDIMIPSSFIPLRELPRTITGKLDRKALGTPGPALRAARPDHAPRRTATEEILLALWSQLLGVEQIGINDNFFDLGGQSILAMQMLGRIKDAFRVDVPIAALFDAPTLGALAAVVDSALGSVASRAAAIPVVAVSRARGWSLSYTQQRLWFLEQVTPGTAAYHTPMAIRIAGPLAADRLEASLNLVLRRQEGLRTSFRMEGQQATQVIAPQAELTLGRVDLSGLPPDPARSEIARIIADQLARPFDLTEPPLMRATLIRLADAEYVMVLVMHHLVFDAWSVGVLCRDIATAYRSAGIDPDRAPLPDLPYHYLDFAAWQRRVQEPLMASRLEFWRSRLADIATLQLPTDRPRPAIPSFRGTRRPFAIDARISAALHDLARRHRATLFMVLLAAFKTLLHRYTGQTDIAIGTPIANRPLTEMEGCVGFFANTLVLRTDLARDPSFVELLGRVRQQALDAYAYQDLPFDEVVRFLRPERDLARQPLFQIMFALQNAPMPPITLPDVVLSEYDAEPGTARFDLTVELHEAEGCVVGHVDYAVDLFDGPTVDRLLQHFSNLLTAVATDPLRMLSALPILSAEERAALLPPLPPPMDDPRLALCLHEQFSRRAAETPDAVALVFRSLRVTYAELDARANRLANHLRGLGVGPETRVALLLDRSDEMVVAILGVLKAGGAYVPMDPACPAERLGFMMADTGAHLVVVQHELLGRIPAGHPPAVCLDDDAAVIASQPACCPDSGVTPGNAAYVIYTSGSTGRPKGVPIEHRNVIRLFLVTEREFAPGAADVWTLFHSYAFDFSVWETWGALLHGGRLVIVPFWQTRSPDALLDLLVAEEVTILNQTPSAFWQLSHACEAAAAPCPPMLRLVIFGGEALNFRRLRGWFGRYGDEHPRLVNMFGITETTVHVTCRPITRADTEGAALSVIGAPLADLRLFLLDRHGQPVPYGVTGELYVGGAGLARFYLNRPALTAERFVANPFGGPAGSRLYRSGDLARRRADGEIEYLGRIDHQVKIRGFRIELAEIETVLTGYPAVREAVVLLREDVPGEPQLVAYLTWQPGRAVLIEDLRRFAAEQLPDYMVPAV
ncbi:MAG TPA: amino acid adenylation domain-containing protein, partial [Acidisphaera sp.]|nr:amino acid adenylation domain-containing protein [Acidisphaera sp.]